MGIAATSSVHPRLNSGRLAGLKFEDQQHVLQFFHTTDKDFCATGFRRLVERWERYVNLQGDNTGRRYYNYDKTLLLLLFTVIFLKELVLELIKRPIPHTQIYDLRKHKAPISFITIIM